MDKQQLINLTDQDRFKYLVDAVKINKEIWLLQSEQGMFAMFEDDKSCSYVAVWPEKELAIPFAIDDWEGYSPARMGIGEFINWLKELKNDQIMIGAFPNTNMKSLAVDPLELKKLLEPGK
jgi:hypothetical protein